MPKNPALHESVKAYVIAAIDLINHNPDERCLSDDWSDSPGVTFIFSHDKLKQLPEYVRCQKALQHEPIIVSQLGILLGVASFRHLSPNIESVMLRFPGLGIYKDKLEFNSDYFEREYKNFESTFYDEEITYEVIVPVTGSLLYKPIKLNANLEICLLTRKDFTLALSGDGEPYLSQLIWAIRAEYTLPKIIDSWKEPNLEAIKKDEIIRNNANSLVDSVTTCLRLFDVSNISHFANIHRTKSFIFQHTRQFMVTPVPNTNFNLIFEEDRSSEFAKFWNDFRTTIDRYRFVDLAARRFSFTYERHNQEDQIIDLLIAAEALFLSQTKEQVNIKARLAICAAYFLGGDALSRGQIENDFRAAYKLRSMIAHGNTKLDNEIKKIEAKEIPLYGEDLKFNQFISRIQHYISLSILKMISIAEGKKNEGQSGNKLVDWDVLIKSGKSGK